MSDKKTYSLKSSCLDVLSEPLTMTRTKSSVRTKGTLSLLIPNFFFLWFRKWPKSMWNTCKAHEKMDICRLHGTKLILKDSLLIPYTEKHFWLWDSWYFWGILASTGMSLFNTWPSLVHMMFSECLSPIPRINVATQ